MPDKRKHRGPHPEDEQLFTETLRPALRSAVSDYSWLLTRNYAEDSALKLVGDRYHLTARQRTAVQRSACSDQSLLRRSGTCAHWEDVVDHSIGIDGYNLLITVESALSGGLVLIGRDGCFRDLASVHGTYRKVEETVPALELIVQHLANRSAPRIDWYLDKPVSNSGRLKAVIAEVVENHSQSARRKDESFELLGATVAEPAATERRWNIELVDSPDAMLIDYPAPIATSDSVVLDRCRAWINLAAEIIAARLPRAWIVDLRSTGGQAAPSPHA